MIFFFIVLSGKINQTGITEDGGACPADLITPPTHFLLSSAPSGWKYLDWLGLISIKIRGMGSKDVICLDTSGLDSWQVSCSVVTHVTPPNCTVTNLMEDPLSRPANYQILHNWRYFPDISIQLPAQPHQLDAMDPNLF